MQKSFILIHKSTRREFTISKKTKSHIIKNLIKKAFHFQSEVKCFRTEDGLKLNVEDLFKFQQYNQFDVVLDEESSEDKSKLSRSEVCSQKNMSKVSGRKKPPSQRELLDSKFYIDDFQFFMSEINSAKSNRFFGIVFFNNRKKTAFLGKKILRELIFEFDKIQFFYALHPIKMHTTSALLGEVCIFSLFKGKKMIHEREFPQQITAADEIPNYLKNLIKIGAIRFDEESQEQKKPRNLIFVHEQRSFDEKIQKTSPLKVLDFSEKPSRELEFKSKIQNNNDINQLSHVAVKNQSPTRSYLTNEISFQNQFYQTDWFYQGNALTRLEKSILSALIKSNDSNLIVFCNGLDLRKKAKEKLNIKLMKVFLKEVADQKLLNFSQNQIHMIQSNQQNRKSFVFNCLLKLQKFGDLKQFVDTLSKNFATSEEVMSPRPQYSYSDLAKEIEKNKKSFSIKLLDCQNSPERSPKQQHSLFHQALNIHLQRLRIASSFHKQGLQHIGTQALKNIQFPIEFGQPDRACIRDLILKNDAFLIQNFIASPFKDKKFERLPVKTILKYIRQVETRFELIRERTTMSQKLQLKMQKIEIFSGLLYYLYKQHIINKKQLKTFFYLYTWSDLKVLSSFQLYLHDRNLDDFVDTLYSIDYSYYLNGVYQIDSNQMEQFNVQIQSQLIILFLYEKFIQSTNDRNTLEKFIRAGDIALFQLYTDTNLQEDSFLLKLNQLTKVKKQQFQVFQQNQNNSEKILQKKKQERCIFLEQIIPAHFKSFKKESKVKYLIRNSEPLITSIFEVFQQTDELVEWIDSFRVYLNQVDELHMKLVIEKLCLDHSVDLERIRTVRTDVIKGIYETYVQTADILDTIDSLERTVQIGRRKTCSETRSNQIQLF